MARRLGTTPLRCAARTHAWLVDGDVLTVPCRDRACPDVQAAKARKGRGIADERVIHAYYLPDLRIQWTEFEDRATGQRRREQRREE